MNRFSLAELERRCQKPDHRRIGNWMARRVTRPMALRVTWVVAPWGLSANGTTLLAWGVGVGAAAAFSWGSAVGWLLGALLLELWYLLDHVDGQLARFHGTSSLDGVQLDYLMHHALNLLVPLGLGHGAFVASGQGAWLWAGAAWGVAGLMLTLHHDARYKAFIQRLKRVRGPLVVQGGRGEQPCTQPGIPRGPLRLAAWLARKACEMHVVMNALVAVVVAGWAASDKTLLAGRVYVAIMAGVAPIVAAVTIFRSQREQTAERQFAAWYRPAPGSHLVYREGRWFVETARTDQGECVQRRENT